MENSVPTTKVMPDIANEGRARVGGKLNWVGMDDIEVPVSLAVEGGLAPQASAAVSAFVNLQETHVRGIHMSRLYLLVDQYLSETPVTPQSIRKLLKEFLVSHGDLSDEAYLRLEFDYLVRRPALKSEFSGWKRYPVFIAGYLNGDELRLEMGSTVKYSSTCPCSAALARQLIQDQFKEDFGSQQNVDFDDVLAWLGSEKGIVATPHSQRSLAEVKVAPCPSLDLFPVLDLIDTIEHALKTPVQTAVKREDEQAFALLNGQNLMFCEDAARRMQSALQEDAKYFDFWLRASHLESLHPHDAVAVAVKGVPGGFSADAAG